MSLEVEKCSHVSDDTKWIFFWFFIVVSAVGITGNMLSVLILTRKKNRILSPAYSVYIIALAIADSGMLFFTGFLRYAVVTWMYDQRYKMSLYEVYLCRLHRFLMHTFHNASVWLLLVMTFDRFLAVRFPFFYRKIKHDASVAKKVCIATFVTSLVLATPFLLVGAIDPEGKAMEVGGKFHFRPTPFANVTLQNSSMFNVNLLNFNTSEKPSSIAQAQNILQISRKTSETNANDGCSLTATFSKNTAFIINVIFHIVLAFLLPYLVLFCFNVAIFWHLNCYSGVVSLVGSRQRLNRKITVMMLAVCFVFIILWLPQVWILFQSTDAHSHSCNSNDVPVSLATLSGVANSALNFFLYCMTVNKFRKAAWNCIRPACILGPAEPDTPSSSIRLTTLSFKSRSLLSQQKLSKRSEVETRAPVALSLNSQKVTEIDTFNEESKQLCSFFKTSEKKAMTSQLR
ncbi:uncharacterized protein LOC143445607 [Clavelina lepadiformis]|uniref:uncharacterized protein LOC143445607 n=1 Tax=Clavelina lepadiformis TaxID=159417 RepID=UPI0040431D31